MAAVAEAPLNGGFRSFEERRKRLGQYFTGVALARLLAALAGTGRLDSVIDPMVGSGDMLVGTLAHGTPTMMAGIELDPLAFAQCATRLEGAGVSTSGLVLGSAFSASVLAKLPVRAWDGVITNPPYVRYQSTSRSAAMGIQVPSGVTIRRDLIAAIDTLEALEQEDKRLFKELAHGYSGLADLAVPSWILCAGLVKVGGTLAMLVPMTWLSRDYAHPIRYLLQRWFSVACVVEDSDASWFTDALVRTGLVVATRVSRRDSAFSSDSRDGYVYGRINASARDERSLVGRLFPTTDSPEVMLAGEVEMWRRTRRIPAKNALGAKWIAASDDAATLRRVIAGERWLYRVESNRLQPELTARSDGSVPTELLLLLGRRDVAFVTLDNLAWRAGQGLRTGANKFFYLRSVGSGRKHARCQPASELGDRPVDIPADALVPVLQRQADVPAGYTVRSGDLEGRVLVLDCYALPEDLKSVTGATYRVMPEPLAMHVRRAAHVNIGSHDDFKYFPDLSAVVTNVRAATADRPARFWYQLPRFTNRHRPSLLLPRINHGHPRALLNENRRAIVDANFSTLWPTRDGAVDAHALLALLNSTWCVAILEICATVMGGGALKVEAAHIRRVPIPRLSERVGKRLSALGHQLANGRMTEATLEAIDLLLFEAMGFDDPDEVRSQLATLAAERLSARSV